MLALVPPLARPARAEQPALPTFEDFRRSDRQRRLTGQLQTPETLALTRVEPALIQRVVADHPGDAQLAWGAAELLTDWKQSRALFEAAIRHADTNRAVVARLAVAAAQAGDTDTARRWAQRARQLDADNAVPIIVQLWLERHADPPGPPEPALPDTAAFRDYAADAARARIQLLERAGYSAYAARRIGYNADMHALMMARDLARNPAAPGARAFLLAAARAMQQHPMFILTEFVGQSIEQQLISADRNDETIERVHALQHRRRNLTELATHVGQHAVDIATESQMIRYFDDMLAIGEETAMQRLAETVRR
jgi:hypothetical protein